MCSELTDSRRQQPGSLPKSQKDMLHCPGWCVHVCQVSSVTAHTATAAAAHGIAPADDEFDNLYACDVL